MPEIRLPQQTFSTSSGGVNLSSLEKEPFLVLYFYPKDNTPGCTIEGKDFAKNHEAFQALGTVVYGISKDTVASHQKFKTGCEFPFELISDPTGELCRHFEILKKKKMFGKEYEGIERSTFLFKAGKLIKEWRNVTVFGHVKEVLETIQKETSA